ARASGGGGGGGVIDLVRGEEAEAQARAMVEMLSDAIAVALGEVAEVGALGQVLAEEAVGVFVGAALPGVMWQGEVDAGVKAAFDRAIAVELGAVIRGERVHGMRFVAQELHGPASGERTGGAGKFADTDQAALALHDGEHACLAAAMNGVDLPVTTTAAPLDDRWSL